MKSKQNILTFKNSKSLDLYSGVKDPEYLTKISLDIFTNFNYKEDVYYCQIARDTFMQLFENGQFDINCVQDRDLQRILLNQNDSNSINHFNIICKDQIKYMKLSNLSNDMYNFLPATMSMGNASSLISVSKFYSVILVVYIFVKALLLNEHTIFIINEGITNTFNSNANYNKNTQEINDFYQELFYRFPNITINEKVVGDSDIEILKQKIKRNIQTIRLRVCQDNSYVDGKLTAKLKFENDYEKAIKESTIGKRFNNFIFVNDLHTFDFPIDKIIELSNDCVLPYLSGEVSFAKTVVNLNRWQIKSSTDYISALSIAKNIMEYEMFIKK